MIGQVGWNLESHKLQVAFLPVSVFSSVIRNLSWKGGVESGVNLNAGRFGSFWKRENSRRMEAKNTFIIFLTGKSRSKPAKREPSQK